MHDYAGSFHVHTSYSFDGNTGVEEIIKAASKSGVDFLVITDHFRLDAKLDGWEGWHNGVLVLVGEEISPRHNHYLALGIEKPLVFWKKSSKPQDYIDAVNNAGGFGLIAHPDHTGAPKHGVKSYAWNDWSVKGYSGISIWDMMTDWQEKLRSPIKSVFSLLFPAWALSGPKEITLKRWDELNRFGRILGYGEIDNHNTIRKYPGFKIRIFPFEVAFKTIKTRIVLNEPLSRDFDTAKRQVFSALKAQSAYVSQESWNSAKGFNFEISSGAAKAGIGGGLELEGSAAVSISLPKKGKIRLVADGRVVAEKTSDRLEFTASKPGLYRVEAWQRIFGVYKPWIFSNHIRLSVNTLKKEN
ncbi:MAG: hypothetical protein A2339_00690 [Elusimicrobia bacterium RIFOXYB12_FULL_50_12]|nr:MAG: hypothetical protein A2278_05385 [Elusimicrobia bacterium RIFOXYA12_FULL_49_49]OGS16490.1 MAG: hypothetical protein A2251_06675 [Elusimicrobia bacterium RIFOXYA2_FULL_47_53]OGS25885.1 MAG: hypothetical protein A2339_00690 [Elusimicrobia bacterium RIFOXYB12_FULL_50_12]OGS31227.1 MAG: hypothetical protein A2323_00960 [Elusimicrobia bacterium RIFOXYB2_FULL_46_23]